MDTGTIMTFGEQILAFYKDLKIKPELPVGVEVLNPYADAISFSYCTAFYRKFYNDTHERTVIFGINPGRHGGGVTGIPFTDPVKLAQNCAIENPFKKKPELSADFIYTLITAYGGPERFYNKFYFSAISPLGFTREDKNLNYYDIRELQFALRDFIIESLQKQLPFGINRAVCYCLGEDKNFKFLSNLNRELKIFNTIVPLAHPRFIMQYRRKKMADYVEDYIRKLGAA